MNFRSFQMPIARHVTEPVTTITRKNDELLVILNLSEITVKPEFEQIFDILKLYKV